MTWHFFPECPDNMDAAFMEKLIALRKEYDRPMPVNSSYRPPGHPVEVKKKHPGAHTFGRAVDIGVSGKDAYDLLALALQHGFHGIGVKQHGPHSGRFLHLDDMPDATHRPRPTVWSYG